MLVTTLGHKDCANWQRLRHTWLTVDQPNGFECGARTAEAEEPRGEARMQRGPKAQEEDEPVAPPVQQVCPLKFGNSDIFGGSYADPTP